MVDFRFTMNVELRATRKKKGPPEIRRPPNGNAVLPICEIYY